MIAGIAVQMISSRVLPWIGGPSSSSSPGLMRKRQTQYRTTTITSTKTGTEQMIRTSQRVSICLPSSVACVGNQSISRPSAMPMTDAISPIATQLPDVAAALRRASCSLRCPSALPTHGRGKLQKRRDRGNRCAARASASDRRGRSGGEPRARDAAGAEVRRRDAVMAPERLRELGRLAVADAVGDLAHGDARGGRAARRRAPSARRSGARGTSSCRSRRTRAAAGGARRRRGGRCRRARGRARTRAPRSRWRPRTGSSAAGRWRGVGWALSRDTRGAAVADELRAAPGAGPGALPLACARAAGLGRLVPIVLASEPEGDVRCRCGRA